jgi:hypothetical protein
MPGAAGLCAVRHSSIVPYCARSPAPARGGHAQKRSGGWRFVVEELKTETGRPRWPPRLVTPVRKREAYWTSTVSLSTVASPGWPTKSLFSDTV